MSRDEVHIRDRLLLLAECSNPHKPFNVKRKSTLTKQGSKSGPKLSVQDFVRMDPGYTPDIEHLVFPTRKRNPQQVAPMNPPAGGGGKTRSRLAEMFALSRHLQQRSQDRDAKGRGGAVNRSVDSAMETRSGLGALLGRSGTGSRRWVSQVEEPVRQNTTRISPAESDMAAARLSQYRVSPSRIEPKRIDRVTSQRKGPNVSVLHLRQTSEPWEVSSTSAYASTKSYPPKTTVPQLTKHQSLGGPYRWANSSNFHSGGEVNSTDIFGSGNVNRELSPVRWCDREVDGVYLGRSGWVQVQQRSLDESRRTGYATTSSLLPGRRTGIKLADYHARSEPASKYSDIQKVPDVQKVPDMTPRPAYLTLQAKEFEKRRTPSPKPENLSPPPITPIISPPPAFQDKNKKTLTKAKTFFGKAPFLPRSNAIDSDEITPPPSPTTKHLKYKSMSMPAHTRRAEKPIIVTIPEPPREPHQTYGRVPQMRSMDDKSAARRWLFVQRHESSSSSSSSMGFRSLDSMVNRPAMPRLSENTDSSFDREVYEDADEEDNNSSSINVSVVNMKLMDELNRPKEKISPSGRPNRLMHYRSQLRPTDVVKPQKSASPGSSSSSSQEFPSRRSPSGSAQQSRRTTPIRQYQSPKPPAEDPSLSRVRRSRSLQLPDKRGPQIYREATKVSPQHPERSGIKMGTQVKRQPRLDTSFTEEDMMREAEVVTGFVYGNRSRAAAQALLQQRYGSIKGKEDKLKESSKPSTNGIAVYFIGGNPKKDRQKVLHRGSTAPNLKSTSTQVDAPHCTSDTCDFWPHCAHRDSLNREFHMRSSQSYPTHQRSLDSMKRMEMLGARRGGEVVRERRVSPNKGAAVVPKGECLYDTPKRPSPLSMFGSSSSSSDLWLTTSDRTLNRVGKRGSGASTPVDDAHVFGESKREMILTRPGSAPTEQRNSGFLESQQRSMSLPKSFLSISHQQGGQFAWRRRGTESLGSSPGLIRKVGSLPAAPETSHTAPVTPLHEGSRRRSPLGGPVHRPKATSTPQLLEAPTASSQDSKWTEQKTIDQTDETHLNPSSQQEVAPPLPRRNLPGNTASTTTATTTTTTTTTSTTTTTTTESVLQKFRKTFSLRFHQKKSSSRDSCNSEVGETLSELLGEPSEEESPHHAPSASGLSDTKDEQPEQKSRFGPLIWRSSKDRKKLNKAARSAKCNSGDSGIQIEMMPGCGGAGDSSESHDTDPPGDDLDSPPSIRRRTQHGKGSRPHSDLLNQILIDKIKSDLRQQRAHRHNQVRRTRSDLGGQRLLHWDPRSSYCRMMSSPAPLRGRPQSPRKKPPDAPGGVQLRMNHRRGQLRRSLSQPLDMDKLSPLMRTKTAGLRLGGSHVLSEDEHDGRIGTSDDEAMSDSESSLTSLSERKKSLELAMDEEMVILAEAVFDHVAMEPEELGFRAGDLIEVLETGNREWWWGSTGGKSGWFPAQFVRLRVSQEDTVEDCLAAMAAGKAVPTQIRRRTSISLLSNDQVRTSVVRELVRTERDFVKVLQDVAEGYIAECRKRKDMFTDDQISTIFINLEEILKFQSAFVKDLEAQIDWETPYKSCVGACFLKHRAGFTMYSEYCNSHPMANAALEEFYQYNNYSKFFEACRLMRGLIEIPLDGYLLTPVQRICKYPLQLAELLKYTRPDHGDYEDIKEALEVMRGVAVLINERKRRMESLEKLVAWQRRVEGWEGEDLIDTSSQLIYQGEVVKVTTGMWTNNITLFLFDHQIVYCKKDILKRNTYVYKGRICLDTSEVIDVPDGKDTHLGVSVRHAIKIYSCVRDKWLLFCCRSSSDKQRWLQAFSEERKLILQDKDDGLEFPSSARLLAKMAARRCQRRPPRKPRAGKNYKHNGSAAYTTGSTLQLNSNSLGRKVGTWFNFGANKKSRHQSRDVS